MSVPMVSETNVIPVTFNHPATTDEFKSECEPDCTAIDALAGLIDANFMPRPHTGRYELLHKRTGRILSDTTRFSEAGVQPNDQLQVVHRVVGAGR